MLINDVGKFALNTAAVPLPANAGDTIVQAPFNTQILRVTDDASFPSGSGIYEYGGIYDTWNADSTAFLSLGPVLWTFDPVAFKVTGHRTPWWPSSYTKIYWSRRDPNVMFFIAPDGIYRWDIRQAAGAKVLDYKVTDPAWVIGPGVDSRGMSGDDDRFMLSRWGDGDPAVNGRLCVVSIAQQKILFKLDVPTDVAGDPTGGFVGQTWTITFPAAFTITGVGGSFSHLVFRGGVLVSAS